jgi:hypothetical protein
MPCLRTRPYQISMHIHYLNKRQGVTLATGMCCVSVEGRALSKLSPDTRATNRYDKCSVLLIFGGTSSVTAGFFRSSNLLLLCMSVQRWFMVHSFFFFNFLIKKFLPIRIFYSRHSGLLHLQQSLGNPT